MSTLFETGIGIAAALAAAMDLPEIDGSRFAETPAHGLATAGLLEHDLLGGIADRGRRLDARAGRIREPGPWHRRRSAGGGPFPGRGRGQDPVNDRVKDHMKDRVTGLLTLARSAARHAADRGASLAVVDGPVRWSWIDLDERARAVAAGLRAAGAGPGSRIALLARPSAGAIAALHGIALVGAAAAPVGRGLTPAELAAAMAAIDPDLVVHDQDRAVEAVALGRPVIALEQLLTMAGGRTTAETLAGGPAIAETDEGCPGRDRPDVRHHRTPQSGGPVRHGSTGQRRGLAGRPPAGDRLGPRRRARACGRTRCRVACGA